MASIYEVIGDNIRRMRASKGLSLAALANRSGIAKGTLFRMEHGGGNPTVETVISIAHALRVPIEEIFKSTIDEELIVVRAGEGRDVSDDRASGAVLHAAVLGPSSIDFQLLTFHAGAQSLSPSHGAGARESVFVISGRIRVGTERNNTELEPGDFATYRADGGHVWEAIGGPSTVMLINTASAEGSRWLED